MQHTVESIFAAALTLSDEERVELAERISFSISDEYQRKVDKAWEEEIARRLRQIEDGSAESVPWEEVRESLVRRGFLKA